MSRTTKQLKLNNTIAVIADGRTEKWYLESVKVHYRHDTLKGIRWSFVPFALSFFAYTLHWWTDTEGSLAAAIEEMRPGYDELMKPVINNIPMLIVAILLTIPVAILAMRLAERALKKQTSSLK